MTTKRERGRRVLGGLLVAVLAACSSTTASNPTPSNPTASNPTPSDPTPSDPTPNLPETTLPADDSPAGVLTFRAFGPDGAELDYDAFTAIRTNGHGDEAINDALLDPATLVVEQIAPLYDDGTGVITLDRPAGAVALAVAWPTSAGYSNVIVDLPPPGEHLFNLVAARQLVADAAAGPSPDGPPPAAWGEAVTAATEALATAESLASADPAAAAAAADRALESAVTALLLPRHARRSGTELLKGVTLDRIELDPAIWPTIAAQAGDREPWVRLVFDPDRGPADYRPAVDAAHAAGLAVLGQFLDSSAMAEVSLAEFEQRVADFLAEFPDIEAWEVGNEINGTWLGPDAAAKAAAAARAVKAGTTARTMLTLYWQLGEDTAEGAMFNWIADHVDATLLADLDDVAVSMWVEEHPMGAAFDRVFTTLAARFPEQRLLVGELGYGNDDLVNLWWWGDPDDPTGAARRAVAADYLALALDRPFLAGGGFWWYYATDAFPVNALWDVLANA